MSESQIYNKWGGKWKIRQENQDITNVRTLLGVSRQVITCGVRSVCRLLKMEAQGYCVKNNHKGLSSISTLLLLGFLLVNLAYTSTAADSTDRDDEFVVKSKVGSFNPTTAAIRLYNYANAILLSPSNITVVETTETSVLLKWSAGTMVSSPEYLVYKLKFKSNWYSDYWHEVDVIDICNGSLPSSQNDNISDGPFTPAGVKCWEDDVRYYYFNVIDLMPATRYDVRIYARFSFENDRNGWHFAGCTTIITKIVIKIYQSRDRPSTQLF